MIDGLKLYYSAYLPSAYPVIRAVSAFLPDGNEQKGLKDLRYASKHAIFVRAEATYFLGNINFYYEHDYSKATHYFELLYHRYPRNNYYTRLLARSLYKMKKYEKALSVINASLKRWKEHSYPFPKVLKSELWYWKGRILHKKMHNKQALALFKQTLHVIQELPRYRYRDFYVQSAYYSGVISARQGNTKEAVHFFNLVTGAKTGKEYKQKARQKLNELI